MTLQRLSFTYLVVVLFLLAGIPFASGITGLAPLKAFQLWVTVLWLGWWVTWLGVGLVLSKKWRTAGVSWIAVGLILAGISIGLLSYVASFPPLKVVSNNIARSSELLDGPLGLTEEDAQLQLKAYPHLKPIILTGPMDQVWNKLERIIAAESRWQVIQSDPVQRRIQVSARDRFFGFTDLVVIEVQSVSESVQFVNVVMRSELDLGAGERRLNRLADRLKGF